MRRAWKVSDREKNCSEKGGKRRRKEKEEKEKEKERRRSDRPVVE